MSRNFQATVVLSGEPTSVLNFAAETIDTAKAILTQCVTDFFPGSWTRDSGESFSFVSQEFDYLIRLKEVKPDE